MPNKEKPKWKRVIYKRVGIKIENIDNWENIDFAVIATHHEDDKQSKPCFYCFGTKSYKLAEDLAKELVEYEWSVQIFSNTYFFPYLG